MVNVSYWKQVQFEELIPSKGNMVLPVQPHTLDRVLCLQTPPDMRLTKFCELGVWAQKQPPRTQTQAVEPRYKPRSPLPKDCTVSKSTPWKVTWSSWATSGLQSQESKCVAGLHPNLLHPLLFGKSGGN